jgi:hypothetical protein
MFPTIHYGLLEDLLYEVHSDQVSGKTIQSLRLSTRYVSRTLRTGEDLTEVFIVVTALVTSLDSAYYGLWVWQVDSYSYIHDRPLLAFRGQAWTRQDSDNLIQHLLASVAKSIQQETGIQPKKGIYTVSPEWLSVTGTTHLIDRTLFRNLVKPLEGRAAHMLSSSVGTLVLGTITGSEFCEFPPEKSYLKADERITLLSPDTISLWLEHPRAYDVAIATKEESRESGITYCILYDPERGWVDTPTDRPQESGGISFACGKEGKR